MPTEFEEEAIGVFCPDIFGERGRGRNKYDCLSQEMNLFFMEQIHEMEAFIKFLAGIPKDKFQQKNLKIKKHFPLYFCFSKPEQSKVITIDDAGFSIVFPNGTKKCFYFLIFSLIMG